MLMASLPVVPDLDRPDNIGDNLSEFNVRGNARMEL